MTEIGSARLGMSVAETLRRKRKITSTTRTSVSTSVNFTSATDSRIVLRAVVQQPDVDAGRELRLASAGSAAFTASATATVFVPGWR